MRASALIGLNVKTLTIHQHLKRHTRKVLSTCKSSMLIMPIMPITKGCVAATSRPA